MLAVSLFVKGHEFMQVFTTPLKFHRILLQSKEDLIPIFHSLFKLHIFPFIYINFNLPCFTVTNPTMF